MAASHLIQGPQLSPPLLGYFPFTWELVGILRQCMVIAGTLLVSVPNLKESVFVLVLFMCFLIWIFL